MRSGCCQVMAFPRSFEAGAQLLRAREPPTSRSSSGVQFLALAGSGQSGGGRHGVRRSQVVTLRFRCDDRTICAEHLRRTENNVMQRLFRRLVTVFLASAFAVCFGTSCFGQQADAPKAAASAKKPASALTAEKPAESAAKPEAQPEPKSASRETSVDKEKDKEEHYDMTEAAPVVTHHQITVDGKLLKYTASTGRLPIKRGDGRIEAEMFYIAYTLDGQ